jgi:hypothetical protein
MYGAPFSSWYALTLVGAILLFVAAIADIARWKPAPVLGCIGSVLLASYYFYSAYYTLSEYLSPNTQWAVSWMELVVVLSPVVIVAFSLMVSFWDLPMKG